MLEFIYLELVVALKGNWGGVGQPRLSKSAR
jgi:hypothetical protein